MTVENISVLRININEDECCRNGVIIDCEYGVTCENLEQGNYLVSFSLSFDGCGMSTELGDMIIPSSAETIQEDIIEIFVDCMLEDINSDIRGFEEDLECLE